ncbi:MULTISPECIES: citrate/2-methylcitrate synthase [Paenibacillus]|uniref:citrate/2-methylcitrate synthase n=1 Tax=Paenibacillus TaxID=44249 RepID=UPI001561E8E9|nr:citrate/2-methylcitrate synthase [Paenibacillus lautus]MBX4148573.1 hypothetical protein [Paenibacillus lautus]
MFEIGKVKNDLVYYKSAKKIELIQEKKGGYPSIEFFGVLLMKQLNLPTSSLFTIAFIGRLTQWFAEVHGSILIQRK